MTKIYFLFLLVFPAVFGATAQSVLNHTAIWYFNYYCGIDFTSGSPISLNNSAMSTDEGTTSISDTNGVLLFYSNGETVYNANHQVMQNGNNLHGGYTSSQSCIGVPQPGSSTIWYLFTVDQGGGGWGGQYSIIDMALQGGLGEVTSKNNFLAAPFEEKLSACIQSNGVDFWILYHGFNTNKFYAFPLTSAGVGNGVISTTGPVNYSASSFVGCMKFSPDGSRLAMATYDMFTVEIFDFDKATGILAHAFTIPMPFGFYSYGLEWTRDSKLLYMGNVDFIPSEIYQADMSLGSSSAILASLTLIHSGNDILGTLQMAPDGKIYVVRYSEYFLGVINNPDSIGAACNYVSNGFSTSPNDNYLGLPNYVTSWFATQVSSPSSFTASDTSVCEKFCIDFNDSSTNNPTSWQWIFNGANPSSSTDQNPTGICYDNPGSFDVTLITTNANGSDTLIFEDYIIVYTTPPFPTITQNGNTLSASPAESYQWQLNSLDISGATTQTYEATQSGLYTVIITDSNGCTNSATVDVVFTGIENLFTDAGLSIYPNPSNGNLIVDWMNVKDDELKMEIFNSIGQLIFSSTEMISNQHFRKELYLNDQPSGIYFIGIKMDERLSNHKFLITK
jgi:PKD repeat protein